MRRRGTLLSVVSVLLGLLVSGCGSDDPFAAYCDEVEAQRPAISAAAEQGATTGLLAALPSFRQLADAAPGDISDDWSVVVDRLSALDEALADADVDPATYDPETPPRGLSDDQQRRIGAAATQLLNPVASRALDSVEQQARDVCGTPLVS